MVFCQEHQFLWNIVSVCLPMWGRFTERFSIANLGNFLTKLPNFASKTLLVRTQIFLEILSQQNKYFLFCKYENSWQHCLHANMCECVFRWGRKIQFCNTQELSSLLPYIFMNFAFFRCKDEIPRRNYLSFLFTVPFSFLIEWVLFSYRESCFWNASLLMMIDSK